MPPSVPAWFHCHRSLFSGSPSQEMPLPRLPVRSSGPSGPAGWEPSGGWAAGRACLRVSAESGACGGPVLPCGVGTPTHPGFSWLLNYWGEGRGRAGEGLLVTLKLFLSPQSRTPPTVSLRTFGTSSSGERGLWGVGLGPPKALRGPEVRHMGSGGAARGAGQ